MSFLSSLSGLISPAISLVTAAVDTAPVTKALSAANHGVEVFEEHNPELVPAVQGAVSALEAIAEKHGVGLVTEIVEGLLPAISALGHTSVNVPAQPAA